jgi:gamma-glutamylcyclotransferase
MSLPLVPPPSSGAPSTPFVYFAYGSSLDSEALTAWCGEHGYRVPDFAMAKPATLSGWRLAFNVRSRFWGGAVASLIADPQGKVEGVAIPLPGNARDFTRHKEGVLSGLYREIELKVLSGGTEIAVVAYVAAGDRALPVEEAPSPKFLEAMIRGSTAHGLSPTWVEQLRSRLG